MVSSMLYGQLSPNEIVGFDYMVLPDVNNIEIAEYEIALNSKYKIGSSTLGLGLSYVNSTFSFFGISDFIDLDELEEIHQLTLSAELKKRFSKNWSISFNISPTLSSNLGQSLSANDFIPTASSFVTKYWGEEKKVSSFNIGLSYATYLGKPQILPIAYYQLSQKDKWDLQLGFPKTRFTKIINKRHILSSILAVSGRYTNISSSLFFDGLGNLTNSKLVYNNFDFGLEYLFRIQPNITTSIRSGYSLTDNLNIVDSEDSTVYDFDPTGSFYLSMGLKYNLK